MSANGGANCQVPSAKIIVMVLFAEIRYVALKPKTQCIGREKKLGFFHPCQVAIQLDM